MVGDVKGMADSGAKVTVIREELVDHLSSHYTGASGVLLTFNQVRVSQVGHLALSVRYLDTVAELRKVRVVKDSIYPLILGRDWFKATGAFVGFENGDHLGSLVRADDEHCWEKVTRNRRKKSQSRHPLRPLASLHRRRKQRGESGSRKKMSHTWP